MTSAEAATGGSRFSAFLSSPWTAAVAVVLAGALVVVGLTVVKRQREEPADVEPVALGEPAPSEFDLTLAATSSPFVTRGEPVSVEIAAAPGVDVARVEVWQDGEPYFVLDDGELITELASGADPAAAPAARTLSFAMDVVPLRAGAHVLLARAYDSAGRMAQSIPFSVPVLDLPQDLGIDSPANTSGATAYPAMYFRAAPGDTLQRIADRLGLDASSLAAADGTDDARKVLGTGVTVSGTVPAVGSLKPPKAGQMLADTDIKAALDNCAVVVTSQSPSALRIYGGAGMVALGDLAPGAELRLTALPIGPTVLAAYSPAGTQPVLPPSVPLTVTIPDECARDAWTGNAYVTGGLLLTDDSVARPYAYIAVDKGEWQRVPAQDGAYLNAGATSISDLRPLIDLARYDQIDLEVWSGETGAPAATGQYCRRDGAHSEPAASSASNGECTPAAAPPSGSPGTTPAKPLTLTLDPKTGNLVRPVSLAPSPDAPQLWTMSGPGNATFSTDAKAQGYGDVLYQFSLIPFSAGSTGLNPPGMFHSQRSDMYAPTTLDPWSWHGALVTEHDLDGVDNLALTDELALGILKEHIAQGANLIDTIYVRAVAVQQVPNTTDYVSLGATSNTIQIDMPTGLEGTWPAIADAAITVRPGRDIMNITNGNAKVSRPENAPSVSVMSSTCHEVAAYPEPTAYTMYPFNAPKWKTKDGVTYQAGKPRSWLDTMIAEPGGMSDLSEAKLLWPRADAIYCLDGDAVNKRKERANNYEPPTCTLGCVLSFVVYGALQGFVVGGPWGALVGGLAGLGVGLGAAVDPEFYRLVKEAWDKVAGFYNKVFDVIWTVVAAVNPACQSAKALGDKAKKFCDGTFQAVGTAVMTYYTGAPPQLATSAQIQATADANMDAMIMLALDAGLKKLGLSCSTFTLSSAEATGLLDKASWAGADVPDLKELKNSQGDLSGCAALAGVLTKTVRASLTTQQGQVMSAITGMRSVPGLVISPVADERPVVVFSGTPTAAPGYAQTCPVVANAEVTEEGTTLRLLPIHSKAWLKYGTTNTDGLRAADAWTGEIQIPYERKLGYPKEPSAAVKDQVPAASGAPYLRVTVTSPCFAQPLVVDAPKYTFFGGSAAFYPDFRPLIAFY